MEPHIAENINILIADDNAHIASAVESTLEGEGLNIFTTTSPTNVLPICLENDISIALIDINMPEVNGFELLEMIKSNPFTRHIMVILITGQSMSQDDVVHGLSMGAVDYLFKPLDVHITRAKVNSLLNLVNYQREVLRKNIELENYQEKLVKAIEVTEKNKVIKENFLANMSHEIRTPLNAIMGLTHLLKESMVNMEQQEMIKLMEYSSKSLLGIVNDILESSKIDAGKITITRDKTNVIDMVKTIGNLTAPMAQEKGLKIICNIGENVPAMIMADALRLNQILINIINNAIKFTKEGHIEISLKARETQNDRALLEFAIKDTGIGIPKELINKIFDRFEQIEDKTWQKFGGTGLGLSIVKRLVELKGGNLKVESTMGEGTTFTFTNWFALATDEVPEKTDKDAPLGKFDDFAVLVAEDNLVNQFITVEILKEWNIKTDVANNGLEAYEKLSLNHYDLILMDTHMPVMNGYEATKKIRKELDEEKKNIPIISFSASVIENEKNEAIKAGVTDFIDKPFEPAKLHEKITKLIEQKELAMH